MKHIFTLFLAVATTLLTTGCSVFGQGGEEIAPYKVMSSAPEQKIELRHYEQMILVSTPMGASMDEDRRSAFQKLFGYISGENIAKQDIKMTAPVFMDEQMAKSGAKISMTAPVFMGDKTDSSAMMSFVMPASFTMETTPLPKDPDVIVQEITDYTVATITFSGLLNQSNIDKHKAMLEAWITKQGYVQTGPYKAAGYNAPFTIPALRRNEVLIPVKVK